MTGDLSEQAEYRLLSTHDLPHAAVLVAGHHGAATSTSEALLRAIRPEAVLISVGADNRFGHPGGRNAPAALKKPARRSSAPICPAPSPSGGKQMAKKKPDDAAAEAERRFKADLKAGTLGSFYIICGEEAFLRSHYVELATKKLTDGPAGEFNFHRFSADDCTPQALADAIDAMPMMAERDARARGRRRPVQAAGRRAGAICRHSVRYPGITAACCSSMTRWNLRSTAR